MRARRESIGQEIAWQRDGAGILDGTARGPGEVVGRFDAEVFGRLDQRVEESSDAVVMFLAGHNGTGPQLLNRTAWVDRNGSPDPVWIEASLT